MKAIVKSDEPIILSIGMIVKNEEKVLRRCLESLKPIMKEIKSELIIADTGSSDSSVEIAKEYTDNVFHFEWTDDFAAARNSTLEKAKGIWYLFIDADEYFDADVSHVVNFFKTPALYNRMKCGRISVRNYQNKKSVKYVDVILPRFHRIKNRPEDDVKFTGKIHETIPIHSPMVKFDTLIHHTGYFYEHESQIQDKYQRNMNIMIREYEKKSDDLRLICHIIRGENDKRKVKKYVDAGLKEVRKNPNQVYRNATYIALIDYYYNYDNEKSLKMCDEYKNGIDFENNVTTVTVYQRMANLYMFQEKFMEAVEHWELYRKQYKLYKEEKLDTNDMSYSILDGLTEESYYDSFISELYCLQKTDDSEKIFEVMNDIDMSKFSTEKYCVCIDLLYLTCLNIQDFSELINFVNKSNSLDAEKKTYIKTVVIKALNSIKDNIKKREFAESLCNQNADSELVCFLNIMVEGNLNETKIKEYIQTYMFGIDELIYLAMKRNIDLFSTISSSDYKKIKGLMSLVSDKHDDFLEVFYNYNFSENYCLNLKYFYWITEVFETVVLCHDDIDEDKKTKIYKKYISLLSNLVFNIYNPEMLNDEDIVVLPELHRFGYYMYKSNSAFDSGDKVSYIRNMRIALANCEGMKDVVECLLNDFRNGLKG